MVYNVCFCLDRILADLSDDLMFVLRSCLAFSIIPRLIQTKRCHCLHLKDVLKFLKPLLVPWTVKDLSVDVTE